MSASASASSDVGAPTKFTAIVEKKLTAVYWLTISRMPYFEDLFVRLSQDQIYSLNVFYSRTNLTQYPLHDTEQKCKYPNQYCQQLLGQLNLLWRALTPRDVSWVVGGWGTPIYAATLTILALLGKKYWIFTDAPKLEGRSKSRVIRVLRPRLLAFWFRRAKGILGTGEMAIERLRKMGASSPKLKSLPYPLDENRFSVGKPYSPNSDAQIVIVCSGRLVITDKRYDLAIEAFSKIIINNPNLEIVLKIAGAGPDEEVLRALAARLGISRAVLFLGWLSQTELADVYRSAHIYLHPTDFEPYGVTVVEALYSGLFTVASAGVGSAVELIEFGLNGIVFNAGDPSDLLVSLETALRLVSEGKVHKQSVRDVSLKWSMEKYLNALDEILAT